MVVHGPEPCGCLRRCSQLPGLRPRAVYRARSLFPILFGCLGCGVSVPKVAASNNSSSSRAKYVSITLTSLGRTAMSSGKSSTTSPGGLPLLRSTIEDPVRGLWRASPCTQLRPIPRLGEREPATLWPRRDAVRLAGGGDGRPSSDAGLRLANLEASTRLIMSVRPWRRREEILAPSWIRTSHPSPPTPVIRIDTS